MEDWKKELEQLDKSEREVKEMQKLNAKADDQARKLGIEKGKNFLREQVEPAFNELQTELKKYVKTVAWHGGTLERHLEIQLDTGEKAVYTILARIDKRAVTGQKSFSTKDASGKSNYEHACAIQVKSNSSTVQYLAEMDVSEITKNDIINDFMVDYKNWKRT